MNLPKDILDIYNIFDKKGYTLFVVGGATRDFIMGKEPHDFDLVTNASPEQVKDILKDYRTDLQGVQFGVVRVFTKDCPEGHEIASYRKDIAKGRDNKSDSNKVQVGDHITIEDDVVRRDISMNALFYDIKTGEVVDLVGGVDDIKNKIIRAVGNPIDRFNEDRLRILRVCRFAATTDSEIDEKTANAILDDSRLFGISDIDDVSKERIYTEFDKVRDKAVNVNDPLILERFFYLLLHFNIISQIYPVEHINTEIKPTLNLSIAIAQILFNNDITTNFIKILVDSKMPNNMLNNILFLIDIYKNEITSDNVFSMYGKMKSKNISKDVVNEWLHIMNIDTKNNIKFLEYVPSTSGKDVILDGFKGVEIGNEISRREKIKFEKMLKESKMVKKPSILGYNTFILRNK